MRPSYRELVRAGATRDEAQWSCADASVRKLCAEQASAARLNIGGGVGPLDLARPNLAEAEELARADRRRRQEPASRSRTHLDNIKLGIYEHSP